MGSNLGGLHDNNVELAKEEIRSAWSEWERRQRQKVAKRRQLTLLWLVSINAARVWPARQLHAMEPCR